MTTRVVGDVAVRVGADVGPLKIGLQDGQRAVGRFSKSTGAQAAALVRNLRNVSVVAVAMGAALTKAASSAINAIDALGKKARQIGTTAESLQELQFGATSAGVSLQGLESSLERFVKRLGEAEMGVGAAAKMLREMNLSASDLVDMGLDDALGVVADKIAAMGNASEQAAAAAALFGREGVAMVNMLRDGSIGLDEFRRRAREAGAVIDNELVQQAEDLEDQIGTTSLAIKRNLQAALIELGPVLVGVSGFALTAAQGIASIGDAAEATAGALQSIIRLGKEALGVEQDWEDTGPGAQYEDDQRWMGGEGRKGGDPSSTGVFLVDPLTGEIVSSDELAKRERERNRLAGIRPKARPMDIDFGVPEDTGGGGGGRNPMVPSESDLKRMEERFLTERELVQEHFDQELMQLQAFRDAKLITEDEYNRLEAELRDKHLSSLAGLDREYQDQRLREIGNAFGDLASLMATGNKKLFAIGKAAAIADAVVSGYRAAVEAWEKGMAIGGPPMAAAFTAASLAKTGALIASIKSQQANGGGSQANPGGSGGGSREVTAAGEGQTTRREITVNLRGGLAGQASGIRDLLNQINQEFDDGGNLLKVNIV